MITKPMLAATIEDINLLNFPLFASPKIDGIRCLTFSHQAWTYSRLNEEFKLLKNRFMRSVLKTLQEGLDGELITLNVTGAFDRFDKVQSKVMSEHVQCQFQYQIFDYLPNMQTRCRYDDRISQLNRLDLPFFCMLLPQQLISNVFELEEFETQMLSGGYEGVILRKPEAPYKQGRSTLKESYLLKLKRFVDAEATIVGFEEMVREKDCKSTGMLGAFICRSDDDIMFNIGTGFTEEQRRNFWLIRKTLEEKRVSFKFQKHGTKEAPRSPVFLRIREDV